MFKGRNLSDVGLSPRLFFQCDFIKTITASYRKLLKSSLLFPVTRTVAGNQNVD